MKDTKKELEKLAEILGLKVEITDTSVTFGEDAECIDRNRTESKRVHIEDEVYDIISIFTKVYIPEACDESILVSEDAIDKLTCSGGNFVQATISISFDLDCEFINSSDVKLYDVINGLDFSYEMSLYDMFYILGMSDSDMKTEFDAEFNNDILMSISRDKVINAVQNITVCDIQYVYMHCLLKEENMGE